MSALALLALVLGATAATPVPSPAAKPLPEGPSSAVADALRTETARAMTLSTPGFAKPYYASAIMVERRGTTLEAAPGALLPVRDQRQRWVRVVVRVGSYDLDNSGFIDQVGGRGSGDAQTGFPLDDDPVAMRRALWLAFDEAYKEAGATYAAKVAFLASQGDSSKESQGDFTHEEPRRSFEPPADLSADRSRLEPLVRRLAGLLPASDEPASRLRVSLVERTSIFVDTEGSDVRTGNNFAALEAAAWDEAADGQPVRDLVMRYGDSLDGLGSAAALEGDIKAMLASVQEQKAAPPLTETYHGPVLLEGDASAHLYTTMLFGRLSQPREPVSSAGGGGRGAAGEWGSRVGSRVLSAGLGVIDDPTLRERAGVRLIGAYTFDFEGIAGKPVKLITSGVLKDFVGTRWPRKDNPTSNGHARRSGGPGWNLGVVALPSNLVISAGSSGLSRDAVRARFLEELKTRELPFGLAVRRLDDSSILQLGATDWLEVADLQGRVHENSELEMPVATYKVMPDGREERVRGVRFGQVPVETLKSVLAVSAPGDGGETVYNSLLTFDIGYTLTGPSSSSFLPLSTVAPALTLLEEAEMKPLSGSFPKKPLAAARAKAAAGKPAGKPGKPVGR